MILISQPQHPAQHSKLSVDSPVRCALSLPDRDVAAAVFWADPCQPLPLEELVQVCESPFGLYEIPLPSCPVVLPKVLGRLLVPDAIRAGERAAP